MAVVFILITLSLLIALVFLGSFLWAVNSGQFEDSDTPAIRMLFENKNHPNEKNK